MTRRERWDEAKADYREAWRRVRDQFAAGWKRMPARTKLSTVRLLLGLAIDGATLVWLLRQFTTMQVALAATPGFFDTPLGPTVWWLLLAALLGSAFAFIRGGFFGRSVAQTLLADELWLRPDARTEDAI